MDADLQALLKEHSPFFKELEDGKIECTLNGHAFAPKKDVIEAFIKGKKYEKLKRRHEAELNLKQYEPFLSQSKCFPPLLFCSLTNQLINKDKGRIEKHVNGKRYARAKERYDEKKMELWVEPTLEEMDAMEAELLAQQKAEEAELAEAAGDAGEGDDIIDVDAFLDELQDAEDEDEASEEDVEMAEEEEAAKKKATGKKKGKQAAAAAGKKKRPAGGKKGAKPAPAAKEKKGNAAKPAANGGKAKARKAADGGASGKPAAKKARK